jgi:hypothetical protein
MDLKSIMAVIAGFTLSACGGGGDGGGISTPPEDSGDTFAVPEASGSDGLDKFISLRNVQSDSQIFNGVGGSVESTRSELTRSVGCSEGGTVSRADFTQASSISSNQVCFGTECATSQNNSYLVSDSATPDIRFDYIYFFGSSLEIAMNATRFEVNAGYDQACSLDGSTPEASSPASVEGTYKGFIYRRNGQSLDRSGEITLACSDNSCSVESDVITDEALQLTPEGNSEPKFIWEDISIRFKPDEPQQRTNAVMAISSGGEIIGGVGIPLDQFSTCYADCMTIALQKQ